MQRALTKKSTHSRMLQALTPDLTEPLHFNIHELTKYIVWLSSTQLHLGKSEQDGGRCYPNLAQISFFPLKLLVTLQKLASHETKWNSIKEKLWTLFTSCSQQWILVTATTDQVLLTQIRNEHPDSRGCVTILRPSMTEVMIRFWVSGGFKNKNNNNSDK